MHSVQVDLQWVPGPCPYLVPAPRSAIIASGIGFRAHTGSGEAACAHFLAMDAAMETVMERCVAVRLRSPACTRTHPALLCLSNQPSLTTYNLYMHPPYNHDLCRSTPLAALLYPPAYLPTCLPTCLPTYLPAYLPFPPQRLPGILPGAMRVHRGCNADKPGLLMICTKSKPRPCPSASLSGDLRLALSRLFSCRPLRADWHNSGFKGHKPNLHRIPIASPQTGRKPSTAPAGRPS